MQIHPRKSPQRREDLRVLVVSFFQAPCREVGGKRFSFLSSHLAQWCGEYHVLARKERSPPTDPTAFAGNVHRVGMFPYYPPLARRGLRAKFGHLWAGWLCTIDPYVGWVVPASLRGLRLCRRHRLNVVVATVPAFSAIVAAWIISKLCGAQLVLDYRDPWTSYPREHPRPLGRLVCAALERAALRRARAAVFCSDIMRREFVGHFGTLAPLKQAVIYNGATEAADANAPGRRTPAVNMVYAGSLYGRRQLGLLLPALSAMLQAGEISSSSFRLHVYAELGAEDRALMDRLQVGGLVERHPQVPYEEITRVLKGADVLFLPSADDCLYAVPFKFYDYLGARRPILAVAARGSEVEQLMGRIDCGEFAVLGDVDDIRRRLKALVNREREYTFQGAEDFTWDRAAAQYFEVLSEVVHDAGNRIEVAT